MPTAENDLFQLVEKSKKILIVIPPSPTDDALCSAIALNHLIEKKQKDVACLFIEQLPERLRYLDLPANLITGLRGARDFILIFNTQHNKIISQRAEQIDDQYVIRLTPEKGSIDPRDFSIIPASYSYDLVIILGTASLDMLGAIYQENPDLFYETPKINIDNQSSNENYGQINLVNMTATSVAEIITELVFKQWEKALDQKIAEALLSGIIAATESFQRPTTTPNAMILAAKLMKYQADQPKIIRHLYKTKSLAFLKLWGRVMARLQFEEKRCLVWSFISTEDLVQSRASLQDIPYVLEKIQESFLEGQLFAIFYNKDLNNTLADVRFSNQKIALQACQLLDVAFNPRKTEIVFEAKNLIEAEKEFLQKLENLE